jgi:uncharacterized MnhB-related membrane protein
VNTLAVNTPYTVPVAMMDVLQVTLLVLVAAAATAVVLFLAFQAPDVTLSELTIGAVLLPIVILLTLAKVRKREQ